MSEDEKDLNLETESGVMQFLQSSTVKVAEVLTGVLSSESKDWKLSAGKLVQSLIKGQLLTQVGREIKKYQEEGKIKEDYLATHRNKATLNELLKFLDEQVPDEELFRALKSIFFSSISIGATDQDEVLAYEFLHTAKQLSGTEILILKANYELVNDSATESLKSKNWKENINVRSVWRKTISEQMGYPGLEAVVAKYEEHLESLGLIAHRQSADHLQNMYDADGSIFRLTTSGLKFSEFIENYE